MFNNSTFLLYGANGYTGRIIAALAAQYQLSPILAGRNETELRVMSDTLKLPYRVVDLNDRARLEQVLSEVPLVLHAAGPFQNTALPMMQACIATRTHYLDITGEIPVFEQALAFQQAAQDAGIMIMPGTGFDVVPTDCMALFLKNKMPAAVSLQLAFTSVGGGVSRGTAKTMISGLGEPGAVRKGGMIVPQPLGHKGMWIDFSKLTGDPHPRFVMSIPWGDIATAHFTTGIPNIETYVGVAPAAFYALKLQGGFNWLLKTKAVRNFALKKVHQRPAGPSETTRSRSSSLIWGKVEDSQGNLVQATMQVKDGYSFTAHSSLVIARKVLQHHFKTGFQTPAAAYGEDLVIEVPESKRTLASYS